jgi:hypothetical protein
MTLTIENIEDVVETIKGLLLSRIAGIDKAYTGLGELTISLSVKLGRHNDRGIDTSVSISFVTDKVKDTVQFFMDPRQRPLFDEVPICNDHSVPVL